MSVSMQDALVTVRELTETICRMLQDPDAGDGVTDMGVAAVGVGNRFLRAAGHEPVDEANLPGQEDDEELDDEEEDEEELDEEELVVDHLYDHGIRQEADKLLVLQQFLDSLPTERRPGDPADYPTAGELAELLDRSDLSEEFAIWLDEHSAD